jgi:uncharacterized protein (DUF1330 family)
METPNEVLIGVRVIDEAGYARYRAELAPLLERHGARFILDVRVAEILRAPLPTACNRLFAIRFPSPRHHDAFFADPDYVALRARLFEPNVSEMVRLGDYALRDRSGVVSAR